MKNRRKTLTLSVMTLLDRAVRLAQVRKDMAMNFYRLFLRTKLAVPVMDLPGSAARRTMTRGVFKFRVKQLKNRPILMVFDSEPKLKAAFKTPTQYVILTGKALLAALTPDLYVLLNAGTPFAKMFLPKELSWLRQALTARDVTVPPKRKTPPAPKKKR